MESVIALVDCDSFFVSCEQSVNKNLKMKPVCVLSNRDGCVVARSKEAKQMGIKMGMPYFMAKKEFPDAIYLSGNHELYSEISHKVMDLLREYSPIVDVYSIDEAFVDLTGLERLYKKNPVEIARFIRNEIAEKIDIPVSIGISSSKTLAKLASDKAKKIEGGIHYIGKENLKEELRNTSVDDIWGIGRQLTILMRKNGILTAKELVNKSDEFLNSLMGIRGIELKHELMGENVSPPTNIVEAPKSIQQTSAMKKFTSDEDFIKNSINYHIHRACVKLRRHNLKTSIIGVMLRTKDFRVFSKKYICEKPLDFELEISKIIFDLFEKIYSPEIVYRSTGVFFEKLTSRSEEQASLFSDNLTDYKKDNLTKCIDKLENKFGKDIIQVGFVKSDI
ncbi:hypothetical protein J6S88_04380 [bacterium]|nr:hypothetical protein [bacterium]